MSFRLILASGSPYRKSLLDRLRIPFEVKVPAIDESRLGDELPEALAVRLGLEKCMAIASHYPAAWVIGSDQVASANGQVYGKPGTHEKALEQLKALQGKTMDLYTAMSVWNPIKKQVESVMDHTKMRWATLPDATLEAYLYADEPYQCAASAKIESMGIALLDELRTEDPTAIIGLPLIALTKLLRAGGVESIGKASAL